MDKRKLAYWASTGLLAFAMLGSGLAKLARADELVANMTRLGYPDYMLPILGFWYVAAALAFVVPKMPRAKEWAYAGVFVALTGAVASHAAVGDPLSGSVPLFVLLTLTVTSYVTRPDGRKVVPASR